MQVLLYYQDGKNRELRLPDPEDLVTDDVKWGRPDDLLTPAFWYSQAWFARDSDAYQPRRLGNSLEEEVAVCLLGGYGMPSEVGWAAFEAVRDEGLLAKTPAEEEVRSVLSRPLRVGNRSVGYRFVRQKSRYLAQSLEQLSRIELPTEPRALRDTLMTLPGVGPKTASWIVRNWCASDDVAIIDVHIVRACTAMGVFPDGAKPARDYGDLEDRFLRLATAMKVRASVLDNLIWYQMKTGLRGLAR